MTRARAVATLLPVLVLGVPATAAASGPAVSHEAVEATRWGILIAAGALLLPLLVWRSIMRRHKASGALSTSKTIAAIWTYLVASILLAFVIAQFMDHPQAMNAIASGVAGDYALLFGGPLGAAILAKQLWISSPAGRQVAAGAAPAPDTVTGLATVVKNESGDADLGNFQYVLFNLIAMVYVVGTVIQHPLKGLPNIPDVLLALTSVSAVGYVAKKAVPVVTGRATNPAPTRRAAEPPAAAGGQTAT